MKKNMLGKNRRNGILLVSFLFLFVILSVSVSALTINLGNIFSQLGQTIAVVQAEGCDNDLSQCYSEEKVLKLNDDFKSITPVKKLMIKSKNGNPIPCNFTDDTPPTYCNDNDCFCYGYKSLGDCTEATSSCQDKAVTKEGWSPCRCEGGETTINGSKDYCSSKLGKVYATKEECTDAQTLAKSCGIETPPAFDQKLCVSPDNSRPDACLGLPCGVGWGVCNRARDEKIKCTPPKTINRCQAIPYAECVQVMSNGLRSGSPQSSFTNSSEGLICFPGSTRSPGRFRFPNNNEITTWLDTTDFSNEGGFGGITNSLPDNAWQFEQKFKDTKSFRSFLCGEDAEEKHELAAYGTQCCVYIPPACGGGFFNEDFFGPVDPHTTMAMNWIDKQTNMFIISQKNKKILDRLFKPAEGTVLDEYSDLKSKWCEAGIRRELSEEDIEAIPEKNDLGDISLFIVGKFSPPLPDATKLYKLSWIIHNKPGSGKDMLFVVYANTSTGNWSEVYFAQKDGQEIKDLVLTPGQSSMGVFSFYSNVSYVDGCILYIKDYDQESDNGSETRYCQGFKNETYNDIVGTTRTGSQVSQDQDRGWRD
jgi:hypothetical protein